MRFFVDALLEVGDLSSEDRARIDAEPKSMKWRIRDRVGDRVRWYAEPEEEPAGA